jgi:Flp pilus assembly protein TadD
MSMFGFLGPILSLLLLILNGCAPREPLSRYEEGRYSRVFERQRAGLPIEEDGPAPPAEVNPNDRESLGDQALREGNLALALINYSKLLEANPGHATVQYKLGMLMLKQGLVDEASQRFTAMLSADPRSAPAHEGLGRTALARGDTTAAEREFRDALALDPSLWKVRNYLGITYDRQKRHREAIVEYQAALALQPNHQALLNNLGLAHYLAGEYEEAVRAFERALQTGSDQAEIPNNLALAYAKVGRYRDALDAFKQNHDEAQAYNNLGMLFLGASKPHNASRCFEKAIELNPRYYGKARHNLELAQQTLRNAAGTNASGDRSDSCP